jgi:hypothetical protein
MAENYTEIRSPWTKSPPIPLNPSGAIQAVDYALRRYSELGIKIAAGNRLQIAGKLLREFVGDATPPAPTDLALLRRISEATQTAFEHYLVSRATKTESGRLNPEHAGKIEMSLSGAEIAASDKNSAGRDTQLELYIGALLAMGDVPVMVAEPDLMFGYDGRPVGLAAKRVKQVGQLRRRFKEATKQIRKSGHHGFVGIGADLLITDLGLRGSAADRGARFNERLVALDEIDQEFSAHPHVLGRFTVGTDFIWHFDEERPTLELGFFRQFRVYTENENEIAVADQFHKQFNEKVGQRMQQL